MGAEVTVLGGGHHYDENYPLIVSSILKHLSIIDCRGDPCGRPMLMKNFIIDLGDHKGRPYILNFTF